MKRTLIITGTQHGCGKTMMAMAIRKMVGEEKTCVLTAELLDSVFCRHHHCKDVELFIIEECGGYIEDTARVMRSLFPHAHLIITTNQNTPPLPKKEYHVITLKRPMD